LPFNAAEILDTRSSFVLFDGCRGHSVCDFLGTRYSIVFFSISHWSSVPMDQRGPLPEYPGDETMRLIKAMLAPPRGYEDGGRRQKSIQEAFGFTGKQQALRWQPVDWCQLPPEVMARIVRFVGFRQTAVLSKRSHQELTAKKNQS